MSGREIGLETFCLNVTFSFAHLPLTLSLSPSLSLSLRGIAPFLGALIADGLTGKKMLQLICGWWMVVALGIFLVGVLPMFGGPIPIGTPVNPIREVLFMIGTYGGWVTIGGLSSSVVIALGADQYDDMDPDEKRQKDSFFGKFLLLFG